MSDDDGCGVAAPATMGENIRRLADAAGLGVVGLARAVEVSRVSAAGQLGLL